MSFQVRGIEFAKTNNGHRVLVLNRNWQAVNIIGVRRAFSLLWQDHARVINTAGGDFAPVDAARWIELSQSAEAGAGPFVRTVRLCILVPKVLLLRAFDRLPVAEIKFNRENVFIRDRYTCQYTGKRCPAAELTLDHVIPRERGGRTTWENIVTCRRDINAMKANRLPHEAGLRLVRKPARPKRRPFAVQAAGASLEKEWLHFLPVGRTGS
ncbi:MAG: HNH endonuclease [Verrucomicrobia bacterium]|jgi:5-methylcytosine-specific restriction endonuclease McrA|nr:HNH endonuclease [Verrucomicrobiota bacterium]